MVGAPSLSQPILWMQPTLQSLPINSSSSSINFHFFILPLLVYKIILTIPTNTLFLHNSAIFHLPPFAYNHPNNLHQKYFPCRKNFANPCCVNGPGSLISPFFLKLSTVRAVTSLIPYRSDSLNWFIAGVANHPIHLLSYLYPIFITSIFN